MDGTIRASQLASIREAIGKIDKAYRTEVARVIDENYQLGEDALRNAIMQELAPVGRRAAELSAELAASVYNGLRTVALGEPSVPKRQTSFDDGKWVAMANTASKQYRLGASAQSIAAIVNSRIGYDTRKSYGDTMMEMARSDKKEVRFARVPSTTKSYSDGCKFCRMLASRGFVYHTRKTAGEFNHYHADCACLVLPGFKGLDKVEGYDPQEWHNRLKYGQEGRNAIGAAANRARKSSNIYIDSDQVGKKLGKHGEEFGLNPKIGSDREKFLEIIDGIINDSDEVVTYDSWRSQPCPVTFYIKGDDVVVVNADGHFVTILKDGAKKNKRVQSARAKTQKRS